MGGAISVVRLGSCLEISLWLPSSGGQVGCGAHEAMHMGKNDINCLQTIHSIARCRWLSEI